jgi:hypothetical protein
MWADIRDARRVLAAGVPCGRAADDPDQATEMSPRTAGS